MSRSALVIALVAASCTSTDEGEHGSDPGSAASSGDAAADGSDVFDGDDAPGDTAMADDGSESGDDGMQWPPGGPGCGLQAAAFCEDFAAGPARAAGRSGELDPTRWSVGRLLPQLPSGSAGAFWIGPSAPVEACRADIDGTTVLPDGDERVCEGGGAIASRHAWTSVAAQNYGLNSHRARTPFDFSGRTGTIVFDADLTADPLGGWVALGVTEAPTPTPSYAHYEYSTGPEHGLELQFSGSECGGGLDGGVHVFEDFVESITGSAEGCVTTEAGHLNHVEVRLSRTHIEVLATDASPDGERFGELRTLGSAELDLPFERGFVVLTVHNHATIKYEFGPAWVARWDDFAFDGPVVPAAREVSVPDALVPFDDEGTVGHFIGYTVAEPATFELPGVTLEGVTRAQLAFTAWYLALEGDPAQYTLRLRWNGGRWRERVLTAAEVAAITAEDQQGAINQTLDVALEDLVEGTNVLEVVSQDVPTNYPAAIANLDLLLYPGS